jgi:TRAP transporter TAXI family solute receptor
LLLGTVAAVAVAAVALSAAYLSAPQAVVMTTGSSGSAYDALAQQYRTILARSGVELRLVPSAGAEENLERLNDPSPDAEIGFTHGGLTDASRSPDLVSLGTLFYEPLWFFCRGEGCAADVRALRGKKVAIEPEGSGTRALVERLLELNGIDRTAAQLLPLSAAESADALFRGEIDAAAMVAPWNTAAVRELLASTEVELFDFPRVDAYVALYPYLTKLVVPAGIGNMAANRPATDVRLLAVKASLIVRKNLDSGLQYLLLDAATQIHSSPELFQNAGQFPAPEPVDLPVSTDAQQFYKSGPPFLQRYLPFRLAALVGKALIVLVPLVGIVYPLVRFAPAVYAWTIRHRIFSLYGELKLIEAGLEASHGDSDRAELLRRLDRLEKRADHLQVPLAFAQILYQVRSHIGLARARFQSPPAR